MSLNFPALRVFTNDRRALKRLGYASATFIFTLTAIYLFFAGNARHVRAQEFNQRAAWIASTASNTTVSLDNFIATWAAKRSSNAEQTSINWIVRDTRDLRQSLLAIDATRATVQRISVTKRDADLSVTAEIAP